MKELGLLQVYTGDGKGKTTASLGLAFRAFDDFANQFYTAFRNLLLNFPDGKIVRSSVDPGQHQFRFYAAPPAEGRRPGTQVPVGEQQNFQPAFPPLRQVRLSQISFPHHISEHGPDDLLLRCHHAFETDIPVDRIAGPVQQPACD